MKAGYFNFLLRLGASIISIALIAVGVLLMIAGLFTSSPLAGGRMAVSILAAMLGVYLFLRVGRGIWRDLRNPQSPEQEKESARQTSPHDD